MTEVNIEKIGKATGITSVVISRAMFVSKVEGMLARKKPRNMIVLRGKGK